MIWIGLLLSLASCKDSLEAITLGGDELPTEGVTLSIQLPNFTPQEISTRAGGETTESITSLWLVCYDATGTFLKKQDCTSAYTAAPADKDGYRKINMNLPKGTETVHLVANVPSLTDAQAAKLDAMKDITPDLSKPICWGAKTLSDLMNDSKISLTRQCAKVTVKTSVSGFEITDLHVWHSASKGSIAPAGYVKSTNDNLATSTELMDDSKCITGGSAAVVAVNETSAGKADIIIKAKYNGTEGFYKVALYNKDKGKTAQYALVRNHNYIVTVISVNDAGYATKEEALKAEPENRMKITVVDDNPEIVDMIACKDYELGVCGTQTVAATNGKDPIIVPITLFTNLKPENTTDNNLYKVEISKDAQSWITSWSPGSQSTTTSPNESAPSGTMFVLNLTLTANNKSEEPRDGTITITSGDLKRTIKIHQEGYDFKRADDRQVLIKLKDSDTPFAYFAWLDSEMHGVKPSENKVNNQEKTRNQGLHFSVGDNTISYLIPKKDGDQFVNKSDKISYSDEVYEGNNYYKVTLNNSTNNFDLWIDEEGFVIKNTEDADHPFTIKYPIYHAGVFGEIKNLGDEQLGETKKGWYYYGVVKILVDEPSEDGKTTTSNKTYYMLDRNLGASNSDFYSPGSANIANDKGSIGGYFKISNGKSSNDYINKYVIGNFRVPKGNELEAIANKIEVKPLSTSTGELYNCLRIPTESSQKDYIYIPISGYYESNSFKDEYHANLWSQSLLSGYQGFSSSSNEYGFWYFYLDIYNKIKTITNTRFVQGYDGSSTGRYKAMPIRLIYVP